MKLKYDVSGDEKIRHIDIVSLYPAVNKHDAYPIGHPEIIVGPDFKDAKEYFGIIKCVVKAPPQDTFPVLPTTCNGKLVFTLSEVCNGTDPDILSA